MSPKKIVSVIWLCLMVLLISCISFPDIELMKIINAFLGIILGFTLTSVTVLSITNLFRKG